jgi:hypothetical protein
MKTATDQLTPLIHTLATIGPEIHTSISLKGFGCSTRSDVNNRHGIEWK